MMLPSHPRCAAQQISSKLCSGRNSSFSFLFCPDRSIRLHEIDEYFFGNNLAKKDLKKKCCNFVRILSGASYILDTLQSSLAINQRTKPVFEDVLFSMHSVINNSKANGDIEAILLSQLYHFFPQFIVPRFGSSRHVPLIYFGGDILERV